MIERNQSKAIVENQNRGKNKAEMHLKPNLKIEFFCFEVDSSDQTSNLN
jgi:hypothetical protein